PLLPHDAISQPADFRFRDSWPGENRRRHVSVPAADSVEESPRRPSGDRHYGDETSLSRTRWSAGGRSEAASAVTRDTTPSRTGVMIRSCLARITTSQSGSNFFQPAA